MSSAALALTSESKRPKIPPWTLQGLAGVLDMIKQNVDRLSELVNVTPVGEKSLAATRFQMETEQLIAMASEGIRQVDKFKIWADDELCKLKQLNIVPPSVDVPHYRMGWWVEDLVDMKKVNELKPATRMVFNALTTVSATENRPAGFESVLKNLNQIQAVRDVYNDAWNHAPDHLAELERVGLILSKRLSSQ
jgi:hypothetical protein